MEDDDALRGTTAHVERARIIAIIRRVERWAKKNATRPMAWKACCEEIRSRIEILPLAACEHEHCPKYWTAAQLAAAEKEAEEICAAIRPSEPEPCAHNWVRMPLELPTALQLPSNFVRCVRCNACEERPI